MKRVKLHGDGKPLMSEGIETILKMRCAIPEEKEGTDEHRAIITEINDLLKGEKLTDFLQRVTIEEIIKWEFEIAKRIEKEEEEEDKNE